jgi:hypothetical protein
LDAIQPIDSDLVQSRDVDALIFYDVRAISSAAVDGTVTVVTVPVVTVNGALNPRPGMVTVPVVLVFPVMKRLSSGRPKFPGNVSQNSTPWLSLAAAATWAAC